MTILICAILGLIIGGVSGGLLRIALKSTSYKLRNRSREFPKIEILALASILLFWLSVTWAVQTWLTALFSEPLGFLLLSLAEISAFSVLNVRQAATVIRLCGEIVAAEGTQS